MVRFVRSQSVPSVEQRRERLVTTIVQGTKRKRLAADITFHHDSGCAVIGGAAWAVELLTEIVEQILKY